MKKKIGVGIIGLGGAGRAHIRYFQSSPYAGVKALFDVKSDVLEEVQRRFRLSGVLLTMDFDEILEREDVGVISVCAPDHVHAFYCIKALKAGKHVLCEKPMVTTLEDCKSVIRAVEKSGLTFAVVHEKRFNPLFRVVKKLVADKEIGEPFAAEADYIHDLSVRMTQYDTWRIDPETFQRALLGGGCHPIDLLRWIINDDVEEVFSYANHMSLPKFPDYDCIFTLLKFERGCLGKALTTIGCKRPLYHPIIVYGTKGTIYNNKLFRNGTKRGNRVLGLLKYRLIHPPFSQYKHEVACRSLVNHFMDCVVNNKTPLTNVYEGAKTVAICVAGIESYQQNKPVKVKKDFLRKSKNENH